MNIEKLTPFAIAVALSAAMNGGLPHFIINNLRGSRNFLTPRLSWTLDSATTELDFYKIL